jgi:hypothetical protein
MVYISSMALLKMLKHGERAARRTPAPTRLRSRVRTARPRTDAAHASPLALRGRAQAARACRWR